MGLSSASLGAAEAGPEAAADGLWQRLAEAGDAAAFCRTWLTLQCGQLAGVRAALLLIEDESHTFVPAAVWPADRTDVTHLAGVAQRCLSQCAGVVEHAGSGQVHVGYPLEDAGQALGAVVLELAARGAAELQQTLRALHWGSGGVEALLLRRRLDEVERVQARARLALDILADVGDADSLDAAAMQVANALALRLDCRRVAVGVERGGRLRLQALSGAAWFERKAEFVLDIENAMEEAIDQGVSVACPALVEAGGRIAVAHRDLAKGGAAYSAVLTVRGRAFGAITCLIDAPREAEFVAALEAAAALLAPLLAARRALAAWFAGRLAERAKVLWRDCADPRRPSFRVAAGAAAVLLALLVLLPGDYRVAGRAVVEGEVQRAVVAPFDGFIAAAAARAGQTVRAGELLAVLDDRDLLLERQKWSAEQEQAERKYRDALARHERANARILAAQLAEAAAQLALAEDKLARARLTAPFDGIVVSGDLSQMLGSPVEKGKLLFEVAPLDAYRVILKLPENGVRDVRAGQGGQIVLAGMADRAMAFTVKNVGMAVAEQGENLFRVEAQLAAAPAGLRPGMEGVAKVAVGERRLLWIWTHALFDWLGVKLWYWLP